MKRMPVRRFETLPPRVAISGFPDRLAVVEEGGGGLEAVGGGVGPCFAR